MQMDFDLGGRVVAVTGATGVLAGGAARYLLGQGAKVAFLSRNQSKVDAAVAASASPDALGVACDVTDQQAVAAAIERVRAHFGRLDALVNGAGGNQPGAVVPPDGALHDLDLGAYREVLDLNLAGTLLPSLAASRVFAGQGRGAIVNFSSASSLQAITRVLGYSNAKAAVDNLTRWMATELARRHGDSIRVNAVCPGFFIGQQNRALLLNDDGSLTERGRLIIANTPMGRFGEADEICGAIHFLLSDAARFVTGQVIHVDGGFGIFSGV